MAVVAGDGGAQGKGGNLALMAGSSGGAGAIGGDLILDAGLSGETSRAR